MLGLILLYWIGKYFYQLAEKHERSKWGFAVLGIVSYYFGIVFFGFVAGIIIEIQYPGAIDESNDFLVGLLFIPFGLLTCYLFYRFLENRWVAKPDPIDPFLLENEPDKE